MVLTTCIRPDDVQREPQGRRKVLGGGAALLAALAAAASPAQAVVQGYTPMTALEGKDYGKSRMT